MGPILQVPSNARTIVKYILQLFQTQSSLLDCIWFRTMCLRWYVVHRKARAHPEVNSERSPMC